MVNLFDKIFERYIQHKRTKSSEAYCNYLRSLGIKIGQRTILKPKSCHIDTTRPSLVTIGEDVFMNTNFTLLTHDFVTGVFRSVFSDLVPSSGKVTIGNNVRFGVNVMVLKGVTIGDNCFIGAGSIVTKDIPANSIAVGNPCKVVCTLEDYYKKRYGKSLDEAIEYVNSIRERFGREPLLHEMIEEFVFLRTRTIICIMKNLVCRLNIN